MTKTMDSIIWQTWQLWFLPLIGGLVLSFFIFAILYHPLWLVFVIPALYIAMMFFDETEEK